jgi:amino acid adenylation domain-containing protein
MKTPVQRANYMADISKAQYVIRDSKERIDEITLPAIDVHDVLNDKNIPDDYVPENIIEDRLLAYILFTSGSTGLPKGAMVEHVGMNNHLSEKIRLLNLTDSSIVANNASISFDVSVWQMLAPLCVGATSVIFQESALLNLKSFRNTLYDYHIQVLEAVPTYLALVIHEIKTFSKDFTDLKCLVSTGESLTRTLVDQIFDVLPDITLVNAYGPTEASDDIIHLVMDKNSDFDPIPIGKPITNAKMTILKPDGSECGVNEPGELLVTGKCVGRGYVGNDKETEAAFLIDKETNERTYKTGDLVSLGEDGNYYFHGRMDTQIAFYGKRVEVKEIENTMSKYDGIDVSAVVFDADKKQINACYIGKDDIDIADLKEFLKKAMPPHMIPVHILKVDEFPTTISGKTDYNALNDLFKTKEDNSLFEGYDPEEVKFLKKILEIIGLRKLPEDKAWENDMRIIGYDSINIIKLVIEIEDVYDVEIDDEKLIPEIIYNYNELKKFVLK